MRTVEEFRKLFETELKPGLGELEARRAKVRAEVIAVDLVGLAIMFSPVLLGALNGLRNLPSGFGVSILSGAGCCFCSGILTTMLGIVVIALGNHFLTRGFRRDFREQVMGKVVKFVDEGLTYEPPKGIPFETYAESCIFLQHADTYHSEDHVSGTVGKTRIEFSEVRSEYRTSSKDMDGHTDTDYRMIFNGVFFVADFNKDFKGLTLVLPDTAEKLFGNMMGSFFQKHAIGRPDLVKMEDPEFEKLFVVYGNDQVEARYILSTALMERLVDYCKKTGRRVHFSFLKGKVYAAIPYKKSLFEPNIWRSLADFEGVKGYFEDLQLVVSIVEDLNLNTRIWGKE